MTNLPTDLKYAPSHEWVRLEKDNIVRVGITDFAQQALGDLVYIDLPKVGRSLQADEQCAVVESVKTASDLYSPVSGVVIAVNEALLDEPELVNEDAFGTWLFCIKANDLSGFDDLMSTEEYQQVIDE
ncbi:MAG: glycine cleavage system protein GcvH [Proteobacteria bacterium]|nr:glycine cleavage system protein GcvH [Pseudomonadota bacterium]